MKWWDATWNTITGCTKVSPACASCWAEERTNALSGHAAKLSRGFGEVVLHERCLDDPRKWRRPRKRIFVNNMSDTFHPAIPDTFILRHLDVVRDCPRHSFLFLTKRSERLRDFTRTHPFPENAWAGVTVESEAYLYRVDHLREANVPHRFLSIEPLLEALLTLNLSGIDWVIVGGEKAASPRPMLPEWVRPIRDNCKAAGVPLYPPSRGRVWDLDCTPVTCHRSPTFSTSIRCTGKPGYVRRWPASTALTGSTFAGKRPARIAGSGKGPKTAR